MQFLVCHMDYELIDWTKLANLIKPEQSGKTFEMIQLMSGDPMAVNFIFCDNSLLLTAQTTARVGSEITTNTIEFSSRKKRFAFDKVAKSDMEVVGYIMGADKIKNVICCTNGKRMKDITNILRMLPSDTKINLWLDEADKFLYKPTDTFIQLTNDYSNVRAYFMTATPKKIFRKYPEIPTLPLENTTLPTYHGWFDNKIVLIENEMGGTISYIFQVIDSLQNISLENTKWYIPADAKIATHYEVANGLAERGFAVFVLNGKGISLFKLNDDGALWSITNKKNDEAHKLIDKLITEYKLEKWPIAITGNLCVGRGLSFMTPNFIFSHGVLSACVNKDTASQHSGRAKGNIKAYPNYAPPTIYTTTAFDKVAREQEKISREVAKLAFKKDQLAPSVVPENDILNINRRYPMRIKCVPPTFDIYKYLKEEMKLPFNIQEQHLGGTLKDGYMFPKRSFAGHSANVEGDTIMPKDVYMQKYNPARSCGNSINQTGTNRGQAFMIYPVYDTLDSHKDDFKYYIHSIDMSIPLDVDFDELD